MKWALGYEELRESFISFAKENKKNEKSIKRAYYSVVSDALETNFCFKGLKAGVVLPNLSGEASPSETLEVFVSLESDIRDFYREAAEMSKALLADVARAVERVARLRDERIKKLRAGAKRT